MHQQFNTNPKISKSCTNKLAEILAFNTDIFDETLKPLKKRSDRCQKRTKSQQSFITETQPAFSIMGRKRLYNTPEEKLAANRAKHKRSYEK